MQLFPTSMYTFLNLSITCHNQNAKNILTNVTDSPKSICNNRRYILVCHVSFINGFCHLYVHHTNANRNEIEKSLKKKY